MPILLIGLNHKTAPVEVREKLELSGCRLRVALEALTSIGRSMPRDGQSVATTIREAVILSTCNRLEVYAVATGSDIVQGWAAIEHCLADLHGIPHETLDAHLYRKADQDSVVHLMQVSSGLDSLVLGEPQIQGQVHRAYAEAHAAAATGPILSHLCTQAVHAGKRARTETDISRHTTSISHAAANLARMKLGDLQQISALILGAGEMAQLAAHAMHMQGTGSIHVINRTLSTAEALAQEVAGQAAPWHALAEMLSQVDVVVTATGAPHTVIHRTDVLTALEQRAPHSARVHGRPLVFIDVAVPRDVDEGVADLPGVICHDVDDLQTAVDANLSQREAEVPKVEAIIHEEVTDFEDWLCGREVVPTIVDLRRKARAIADAEVAQASRRVSEADVAVLERLAHRLVNKLLHEPTIQLKAQAAEGEGHAYAHVVRELFALDESTGHASHRTNIDSAASVQAVNATTVPASTAQIATPESDTVYTMPLPQKAVSA